MVVIYCIVLALVFIIPCVLVVRDNKAHEREMDAHDERMKALYAEMNASFDRIGQNLAEMTARKNNK